MDDTSALEEESFAIVSIYGPSSFYPLERKSTSTKTTASLEDSLAVYTLKVSLEEPDFDFDPTTEDNSQQQQQQQQQQHKNNQKELEFRLYFPKGYPESATSAPVHEIVSIYYGTLRLTDSILQEIDQGLDQCYVPGEVVVFTWIEWLRTFLEDLESRTDFISHSNTATTTTTSTEELHHHHHRQQQHNSNNDIDKDDQDNKDGDVGDSDADGLESQRTTSDYFLWDDNVSATSGSTNNNGGTTTALASSLASLSTSDNPNSLRVPRVGGIPEFSIRSGVPIIDRKSVFVAHLAPITQASHVPLMIQQLKQENKKVVKATHNIMAFRIENENGAITQDNDDDGETAAGSRLLHLMSILDVKNVVVVVSRWYGGIPLSADRFKHINNAARQLLDESGYIKPPDSTSNANSNNSNSKSKSKGRHNRK
ncbi:hypothetical protein BGZ76_007951 [Entomortierella beljakovae]|nr:hypothetical protein BGZ76_007951 [Entomortierella beljakovae]